jgi:hypothetical protein
MRKFIVLIFLVVNAFLVFAQKYQPVDSNMVWQYTNSIKISGNPLCIEEENASYQFHGFTINNGNIWYKLFKSATFKWAAVQYPCTFPITSTNYTDVFLGYLLNDSITKKTYFTPSLNVNHVPSANEILFDFLNKNVGDSISFKYITPMMPQNFPNIKFKITYKDSLLISGKYHKSYTVQTNTINAWFTYQKPLKIIEGVGSTLGPFHPIFTNWEQWSKLKCFSKKQSSFLVTSDTSCIPTSFFCGTINAVPNIELPVFSISPNPVSNILNITDLEPEQIRITDIFGKVVLEQNENASKVNVQALPPGLYMIRLSSRNRTFISKFIKE